eukprot:TRINITY_DN2433_c0_g1_i1.p1 TRINITY_DN2433_c0_g1~~TRINITY_DN2433_c0_g1_i1.p1  ORF type:complete len:220 (+),score=44.98 TRINITY_DN2433_c0_g1_i1:635-1294(+)
MAQRTWTAQEESEYKRRCRLEELFKKYDKDQSGYLDETELLQVVKDAFNQSVSPAVIARHTKTLIYKHDKDRSGQIEFEEFVTLYSKLLDDPELPIELRVKVQQADNQYNPEASGHKFVRPEYVFTEKEKTDAIELFKKYDKDNSESIEKNELKELLKAKMGPRTSEGILNRYVESGFDEFDKDKSGSISLTEFMALYKKLYCNPSKPPVGGMMAIPMY